MASPKSVSEVTPKKASVDDLSSKKNGGGWYTGDKTFDRIQAFQLALVLSTAAGSGKKAPYGKFANRSLGSAQLDPRFGWWLMELPATVCFLYHYLKPDPQEKAREEENERAKRGPSRKVSLFFAFIFIRHYLNRGWFFPLSIRVAPGATSNFSFGNSMIGAFFTGLHGYLNARMFRTHGSHLTDSWFKDPRFVVGIVMYEIGFWITVHSEWVMRNLRTPGGPRYSIPNGGLFHLVTNPHYFGELLAFLGFSTATWSIPGLAVFLISALNLTPRSFQNHTWYLQKFGEGYAKLNRKVLVPYVI